ncbi:3-hydroxyacyl-CoA dehydrogenase [Bartonella sp. LJL80]
MKLQDSVFLVTGAGSGLGAAVSRMVVAAGGKVVLADLKKGEEDLIAQSQGRAVFIKTDVTNEHDGLNAVDGAKRAFGRLDVLVNCAGIAPAEKLVGREGPHDLERFSKIITTNLIGTFNMTRLCADVMSRQEPGVDGERGVIIMTSSISAFDGQIGQVAYAASKAGVAGMALPIAREMARFGIRCVAIAPGIFETPMMAGMPEAVRDSLGASVPFPSRLGKPQEYAALVRHICENMMLNGETIRLDGALRMAPK